MNLVARVPRKGIPTFVKRMAQGVGGLLVGRRYAAGGQGLTAGLFAGVLRAGIPVWTDTALLRLDGDGDRVRGAVVRPRRTRGDDHRPARRGAGHGRFRPQHGYAVEIPVRVAGRQPEPGRGGQYRRRDPCGPGIGRRHRFDGPGVVVPRRRAAARQAARGDAGRTVASRLPDRGPERPPVRQRVGGLHVVRSAVARTRAVAAALSKRCGSSSTSNTATVMSLAPRCFRGCAYRRRGTTRASRNGPTTSPSWAPRSAFRCRSSPRR